MAKKRPGVRNEGRPGRFRAVASAAAQDQQAAGQRRMRGAGGGCPGGPKAFVNLRGRETWLENILFVDIYGYL